MCDWLKKYYDIFHFPIDKMIGEAFATQHIVNGCQRRLSDAVLATEGLPDSSNKTERFCYKGEWVNA